MYMMVGHTPDHSAEPALGLVTHTLSLPSFDTNPLPLGEESWAEGTYKIRLSSFLANGASFWLCWLLPQRGVRLLQLAVSQIHTSLEAVDSTIYSDAELSSTVSSKRGSSLASFTGLPPAPTKHPMKYSLST